MWTILQQDEPEDYLIAIGVTTYERELVRMAFAEVGIQVDLREEVRVQMNKVLLYLVLIHNIN
jgi:GDPmannose 4,6-dehydratase